MAITWFILIYILLLPIVFLGLELLFCRFSTTAAVILPIVCACLFIFLGFYAVILAALMYAEFFAFRFIKKEKAQKEKAKMNEIDKMNINDL